MKRILLVSLPLLLAACDSSATVYNRLGNNVGSVQAESESAIILDAQGVQVGNVKGNQIRNTAGETKAKTMKREGAVVIEGVDAMGYLEKGTECYRADGLRKGRLSNTIDGEAAAGACYLLLLTH